MLNEHIDHDHETRELSDDELELVSGGVGRPTTCPCGQQHLPRKAEDS